MFGEMNSYMLESMSRAQAAEFEREVEFRRQHGLLRTPRAASERGWNPLTALVEYLRSFSWNVTRPAYG